jgi:hypothetical protein
MGYYSDFHYEEEGHEGFSETVLKFLEDNKDVNDGYDCILYTLEGESTKFYEYKDTMIELSKEFCDREFMVHRNGEGNEDIERSYFQNGKSVHYTPELLWPDFNPKDLK